MKEGGGWGGASGWRSGAYLNKGSVDGNLQHGEQRGDIAAAREGLIKQQKHRRRLILLADALKTWRQILKQMMVAVLMENSPKVRFCNISLHFCDL